MAAVTADQIRIERAVQDKVFETYAVTTSQTVYIGTLVSFAPGAPARVRSGAATANYRFAGIVEEVINDSGSFLSAITGNADGTVRVKVSYGQEALITCITAMYTTSNLNKTALLKTNNEVEGTAVGTAALRQAVGMITEMQSTNLVWVKLRQVGTGDASG
jgi:hypothetical protein